MHFSCDLVTSICDPLHVFVFVCLLGIYLASCRGLAFCRGRTRGVRRSRSPVTPAQMILDCEPLIEIRVLSVSLSARMFIWAFLLTVKRDTGGANNQVSEKLGS